MPDPFNLERFVDAQAQAYDGVRAELRAGARLVEKVRGRSIDARFGWPDNLKLRSSMTLFARATDDNADFHALLDKYYAGEPDPRTLELL